MPGTVRSRVSFARQAGLFWMVSSRSRSTAAMRRFSQRICRVIFSTERRRGMLHAIPLGGEHVEEYGNA